MSNRASNLIVLTGVVFTVLLFLISYARHRARVQEEFVADLRLCTFSDVLEPTLREFFSETNLALLGTAANVYFDGVVKVLFTEYERSDWERTTRAVNDVLRVLLRGVDMGRLILLLTILKGCVRQEIARVESVVAWLSDDDNVALLLLHAGRCVYESLTRGERDQADDPLTVDDLYLMLTVVQRNARIVDLSSTDVPETLRDVVVSLRGEIIPREYFIAFLETMLPPPS